MNILITGAWREYKQYKNEIELKGHRCLFLRNETDILPCEPNWIEGVICNGLFLYHDIKSFTNLRYIQLVSTGYDRTPMEYIHKNNIEIHNAKGVYSIPIAEYVVSKILNAYRDPYYYFENQKNRSWTKKREIRELFEKNICIIGCGSIGRETAKRLCAFGCHITGVARSMRYEPYFDRVITKNTLNEALSASDVVIIAIPHTPDTENLINANRLTLMNPGTILINISRGAVLEEEALPKHGLHLGKIILDVFKNEPLPEESPLWDMENVIITPHNSFVGEGNGSRLAKVILDNLPSEA